MGLVRSLTILSHLQHRIGGPLAGVLPQRLAGMEHALFDMIAGAPPPGDSQVLMMPHTHDGESGVAIPRGTLYSYDSGDNSPWAWSGGVVDGYWRYDFAHGNSVAATSANDTYPPNLWVFPTDTVDSNNTAEGGSACALEAMVFGSTDRTAAGLRLRNRTTGSEGTKVNFAAANTYEWITLGVPVAGGRWNAIDLESWNGTSSLGFNFDVLSLVIAETRSVSQPQSAGSHTMAAAPKP